MARGTESLGDAMLILIHTKREARGFDTPRLILRCDSILIHTKREARGGPHTCINEDNHILIHTKREARGLRKGYVGIVFAKILIHTKREARGAIATYSGLISMPF